MTRPRFALDENFPTPILAALSQYVTEAELVPVRTIDPRLEQLDDWELLVALRLDPGGWAGLVTTDSGMLSQPRELSVLAQTNLALVVIAEAGHDPLKATGLLLAMLPGVCGSLRPGTSQVFRLRAPAVRPEDPWEALKRVAKHRSVNVNALFRESRASDDELNTDPRARKGR